MGCSDSKEPHVREISIYEFKLPDSEGRIVKFSKYMGNVMIIVNIASGCQLANKNISQLNELYSKYKEKGLRILGFPCDQFEEMGLTKDEFTSELIKKQLKVNFDLFSPIEVNGKNACGLYRYLRKKSRLNGNYIGWNFGKFLLDSEGYIVDYYGPTQEPLELEEKIVDLLSKK